MYGWADDFPTMAPSNFYVMSKDVGALMLIDVVAQESILVG